MRSYNASFVYSRLWLLARETNAFSRELAGFYATNISHFPSDWAPREYVGCTARQQQAAQPHLKLGWCHQWCSSSLGCTGKAWELLLGGDPSCSPAAYPTHAHPSVHPASDQQCHMGSSGAEKGIWLTVQIIDFHKIFNWFRTFCDARQQGLKPYPVKIWESSSQLCKTTATHMMLKMTHII